MDITLVGHSTLLIEAAGVTLLTDPLLPSAPAGGAEPSAEIELLIAKAAAANLVLVSHAHSDHLDPRFFARIPLVTPVVVPAGLHWPRRIHRPENVHHLELWATYRYDGVAVTAVPAPHIGLACGYVIEAEGRTVYFAGDTRLGPHFKAIAERFHLDLALLPLRPLRLLPVMGPKDIVPAVQALGSPAVALIHLGPVENWLSYLALPDPVPEVAELLAREAPQVQLRSWRAGAPLRV